MKIKKKLLSMLTIGSMVMSLFTPITPKAADIEVKQGDFFLLGEGDSQSLWFCFSTGESGYTTEPGTFLMSYYAVKEIAWTTGGNCFYLDSDVAKYLDGDFRTEYNTAAFESLIKKTSTEYHPDGTNRFTNATFFLPNNQWCVKLRSEIPDLMKATNANGTPVEWFTCTGRTPTGDVAVVRTDGMAGSWGYNPKQTERRWVRPAFQLDVSKISSYIGSGTKEDPYREPPCYTVSVTAETGGNITSGTGTYTSGDSATLVATADTGYSFAGWYDGETLKSSDSSYTFTVTGNTSLTAKFTAKTCTITYNNDGAETTETATYGQALPSIEVPAKADYTFGGYYTEQSGGGTQYYGADGSAKFETSALTEDITLYAYWTQTPAAVSGTVEAVVADNTGKDNEGNTDNGATGFVTLLTKSGIPDFTISKITWAVTSPANDNAQQTFEKVPETTITLTGTDAAVKVALVIGKLYDANATANITVE